MTGRRTGSSRSTTTTPETLLATLASPGWGDGLPLVAPTPERVEAHARARPVIPTRRSPRCSRGAASSPAGPSRSTRCSRAARPMSSRSCSRAVRAPLPARGEPARRQRDDPSGGAARDRARRDRAHRGVQRRGRRLRTRQPRQRHRRSRGTARAPPPRGRATGIRRRGDPGPAVEVHLLRRREPGRVAVGGLRRQPRRRRAERGHGALRREPAQRARPGSRRCTRVSSSARSRRR